MNYSVVKTELEPIIHKNEKRLVEIEDGLKEISRLEEGLISRKSMLLAEKELIEKEQSTIHGYFDALTKLYHASLIIQQTGEPLGGLYYRTNNLNSAELSHLVAEQKIYEVLHIMNTITINRILCQRDSDEYVFNGLVDDLLVLDNCIHSSKTLYDRFVSKYGQNGVLQLLTRNLSDKAQKDILRMADVRIKDQNDEINTLKQRMKNNDAQIDRLMSRPGGNSLYRDSEYYKLARSIPIDIRLAEKKRGFYISIYKLMKSIEVNGH